MKNQLKRKRIISINDRYKNNNKKETTGKHYLENQKKDIAANAEFNRELIENAFIIK